MPRYKIIYPRQKYPAEEARKQSAFQSVQQRQAQTSAYAAARFQEWAANAPEREALLNARMEQAQSQAELAGAQFRYNFWKDQELRRQTTAYYTAMPALQESLKQAGIFPGSARYAAEISAFAAELPDAVTHNEAIRNDLKGYAKVDEDAARIQQMMAEQGITKQQAQIQSLTQSLQSQGQRPTSFSTTAQGGVDVKATRAVDKEVPVQALMRYGKLVGDITEFADLDKARVSAAQKEKSIFEAKYPGLQNLVPTEPSPTPTPATTGNLNPLQRGLVAVGLGKAPESQPTPTPSPTPSPIEVGTQRTINGQLAEWDGQGWSAVQQ